MTVILSSKFSSNISVFDLQPSELPVAIIDNELSNDSEIKKNANVQEDCKINIKFLDQDSKENTDVQSDAIREAMKAIADRVACNIYQIPEVRPQGNQKYRITPGFHMFPSDLTGVQLDMQVNYNTVIDMSLTPST